MNDAKEGFIEFIKRHYLKILILLMIIVAFNLFYNLKIEAIKDWDEARHGVNAYEMLKSGNYLVNTYGYQPDYYNLKPPLSLWLEIAGYKIAGFNPLGLRIFSGAAAFITILIAGIFTKAIKGEVASLASVAILGTSTQYILSHGARSGDADSLFILFFTLSMIAMLLIRKSRKWLYLVGFSFSSAFLAKSWHSGVIIIIAMVYLIITGLIKKLKVKDLLVLVLSSSLPILIWGIYRYSKDGFRFFEGMLKYDLLSRTSKVLEGHNGGLIYYLKVLGVNYFFGGAFALLILIIYILRARETLGKVNKDYTIGILLWMIIPFLLFTIARTKLAWYILPVYPPAAIGISIIFAYLIEKDFINHFAKTAVVILLIGGFLFNEAVILKHVTMPDSDGTQAALRKLSTVGDFHGYNIYTLCGTYNGATGWDQKHFLAAELYDDLFPAEGGFEAFLKTSEKKSLIIVPNDKADYIIKNNNLKIVLGTETNYILKK